MSGMAQVIREPKLRLCISSCSGFKCDWKLLYPWGGGRGGTDDLPADVNRDQRSICFPGGHGEKA